ncbi:MAG: DUF4282 domain-containing protein [Planctomycetaceae bacterium]|nr:DUF4282 domain-containing protein [Planctomycetaceae bacterium]
MDEMDPISGQPEPERPRDDDIPEPHADFADETRQGGWKRLFSFESMFFPVIARYVFMVYVVLVLLVGVAGVFAAFSLMARIGFSDGMFELFRYIVGVVLLVLGGRLWLELVMVVFKIHEALQDIRSHVTKTK